jgi:hypothetical protein
VSDLNLKKKPFRRQKIWRRKLELSAINQRFGGKIVPFNFRFFGTNQRSHPLPEKNPQNLSKKVLMQFRVLL